MGGNNPTKSLPNRKDLPTTTKTCIPSQRTNNSTPKATKMEPKPKGTPELEKRLENKPTHPKTLPNTLPTQNIRQSPQVHTRPNRGNKPALHQHHMRKAPNMNPNLTRCACYKCRRQPNLANAITLNGKDQWYYCNHCFPFIKDYFAHPFIKGPMEV